MSGQIIPTPAYKASEWYNFTTLVEKQRLGFIALSLTNYDNYSLPQIAAGSVIEISGSLFKFPSNDSIGGTPTSGQINYIMLEVSGSGDSQTVSGLWTTTAPTWNDSKAGWYDATGNKRYVAGCYYDGTNYDLKWIYNERDDGPQILYRAVSLVGDEGANVSAVGHSVQWGSGSAGAFLAQIHLPQDAIVTELYSYCDVYADHQITIYLYKCENTDSTPDAMASTTHTGTGAQTDTSINSPKIDNSNKKYWIKATTGAAGSGTTAITAIRIKYIRVRRKTS